MNKMNNLSKSAIIWLIISIALSSAFMIFAQENPKIINSSLFTQLVIVTVGSILGLVGALIGYAIRQFAKPRTYVSSDGVIKIIKTKVFWGIMPQLIGCILGTTVGILLPLMRWL